MRAYHADVLLIVDHKWRDLPGMAALRVWLEDVFNCPTALIHYGEWTSGLMQCQPQVIVLSHMNGARNQTIAKTARQMGVRVAVIQTEGRPNNIETMQYTSGQFSTMEYVDLWFTWSETVRDFMLGHNLLPADKLVVGGVPRFDIYRPELNRLLMPRAEFAKKYDLDPHRPTISWATNFTTAKFHVANQELLIHDWQDLGMTRLSSVNDPLEFASLDWQAREQALKAISTLMLAHPDIQFILKPHPAEELNRYQEFVAECHKANFNVTLVAREYIWDILNAVDIHIHRLCTTGVEAWLLDVPSIELHQFDYGVWSTSIPGAASEATQGNDVVADADHLIERVAFYLKGGKPTATQRALREQYIRRWLYQVDGQRCYVYAHTLASLIQERHSITSFPSNQLLLQTRIKHSLNRLLGRPLWASIRFWRRPASYVDPLGQVDKSIALKDVECWTARARQALKSQMERYR